MWLHAEVKFVYSTYIITMFVYVTVHCIIMYVAIEGRLIVMIVIKYK